MPETPDPRDLELLGLKPGATTADLHRAYQRARATWAEESLATYGLVDEAERDAILARLTMAYERLSRCLVSPSSARQTGPHEALPGTDPSPAGPPAAGTEPTGAIPGGTHDLDPGALLRRRRLASEISLDTVARETRIRTTILEALEEGNPSRLPAPVYIRGFVIAFAQVVGIDEPEDLARRYLDWLETRGA